MRVRLIYRPSARLRGVEITWHSAEQLVSNPSLDRADNSRGYVRGNVYVVSKLGNTLKGSLTLDDARRLVAYLEMAELLA